MPLADGFILFDLLAAMLLPKLAEGRAVGGDEVPPLPVVGQGLPAAVRRAYLPSVCHRRLQRDIYRPVHDVADVLPIQHVAHASRHAQGDLVAHRVGRAGPADLGGVGCEAHPVGWLGLAEAQSPW